MHVPGIRAGNPRDEIAICEQRLDPASICSRSGSTSVSAPANTRIHANKAAHLWCLVPTPAGASFAAAHNDVSFHMSLVLAPTRCTDVAFSRNSMCAGRRVDSNCCVDATAPVHTPRQRLQAPKLRDLRSLPEWFKGSAETCLPTNARQHN